MKKTSLIILILIAGMASRCLAQTAVNTTADVSALRGVLYLEPADVTGNQYLAQSWKRGSVMLSNGDTVSNQMLNYNGYLDALIWLNPAGNRQVLLEKHFVAGFTLNMTEQIEFRFKHLTNANFPLPDTSDFFAEVMHEGAASLYVIRHIATHGTTTRHIDDKYYTLGSLKPQPQYFLILPDRQVVTFRRLTRKYFISVLPSNYQDAARAIIRSNHLSLRDESQLVAVVRYLK